MIDLNMDTTADRALHDRFIDVYRQQMSAVTLWPPMDVYELFWRLGRGDRPQTDDGRPPAPSTVVRQPSAP